MKPKLIIKSFGAFGLNTYETKSYLSLLEKDSLTAVEVAKISGVPRGRVYEILENLLAKGFCHSIPGKVKKYKAVNPTVLQERIQPKLKVVESEIDQKKRELVSIKKDTNEIIENLVPLYNASRSINSPLEYIEVIKDPHMIHKRFMQLRADAKEEILSFTKPPFSVPKDKLEKQVDQEAGILSRSVRFTWKSIYEICKDEDERRWQFRMIERAVRAGEEARVINELPMKAAIFDSRIVLCTLEDPVLDQPSFTAHVVEHPALAKTIKITFETLWEKAEDFHILQD